MRPEWDYSTRPGIYVRDVNIRWRQHYTGQNWDALIDGRVVAEVVPYGRTSNRYWTAWIGQRRIGNYPTDTEAKRAVERHL